MAGKGPDCKSHRDGEDNAGATAVIDIMGKGRIEGAWAVCEGAEMITGAVTIHRRGNRGTRCCVKAEKWVAAAVQQTPPQAQSKKEKA